MNELDKLEKYLKNQDLFDSLEALRGLRAKCARLEREANWLAGSLKELDKLEKYLKNQDLFDSLEALRGLRAKCARLEREANWLLRRSVVGVH